MNSQRGFTLLELMVVIGIFALLAVMAYGGLDSVLSTRKAVEASMTRTAEWQKAYQRLRNDLQQVRNRPARDGFGDLQGFRYEREGRLQFTRSGWRNPLGLKRPSLERVHYRLDDGQLLRESWRVLDQAQDSPVASSVLLSGVEELRWRFMDNSREWQETWPPGSVSLDGPPQPPPLAIELRLRSKDWDEVTLLFRAGAEGVRAAPGATP